MLKEKLKSVRVRLFLTLCVVVIALVICLIAVNSLVLENFYIYSKTNTIKELYNKINDYYGDSRTIDSHIKKIRHTLGKKGKYIETMRGVGYKFEVK